MIEQTTALAKSSLNTPEGLPARRRAALKPSQIAVSTLEEQERTILRLLKACF